MATKPATITKKDGKTLYLSQSGKSYQAKKTPTVTASFTPTAGANKGVRMNSMSDGTKVAAPVKRTGGSSASPVEPTTLSDTNIRENVIPDLNSKANKLTETGQYRDTSGNLRNSDGTIVDEQDSQITDLTTDANSYSDSILKTLDDLMASTDADTMRSVRGIKSQYNVRQQQLEDINAREQANMDTALLNSGSSRYTMSGNSASAAQSRYGIMELAQLDAEEQVAIAEVKAAQTAQNYKVLESKVSYLEKLRGEKVEKAKEIAKQAAEENKALMERNQELADQEEISKVLKTGITDPVQIFQALGGKVPFDRIKSVIDIIPEASTEQYTLGRYDVRYDASGKVIARGMGAGGGGGGVDISGGVSVGAPGVSVGAPTVAGLGATYNKSSPEAQMVIDDILNKIPAQLRNTEKEVELKKEQIRKQLAAGYSYQDVVDRLSGFSLQGEKVDKGLGSALYNLSLGTELDPGTLASMLNRGASEQAMTTVENAQLGKVDAFFAGTDKARATVKQAQTVLSILNDPTFPKDDLGPFDGRTFKITKWRGLNDADAKKVQSLETALQLLAAPIRVEVAGSAATEGEMAKISAFQSSILDQPNVIESQVKGLMDSVVNFHNEARSQRGLPTVTKDQLTSNQARLQLYKQIGGADTEIINSRMTNSGFLNSGAWGGSEPAVENTSDNKDFFNNI